MLRKAFPTGLSLAVLALSGCLSGGEGGENPQAPSGNPDKTYPYVVQGDEIIDPPTADTSYGCHGDTLAPRVVPGPADTTPFRINGDTLTLVISVDTPEVGAAVERVLRLARTAGRDGLEGTWRYLEEDYRIIAGTLTPDGQAQLDADFASIRFRDSFREVVYVIGGGFIRIYEDERTAERAIARWNGSDPSVRKTADSAKYEMDVRIVDKYTVEYRGRRTSETVRVTEKPNGDLDFVSLDPSHPPAHILTTPTSCPPEVIPAWYFEFQAANRNPAVP